MIAVRAYNRCQSCQQSVTAVHILLLAELSGIWFIFIVITFPVFVSAWKIVIWGIICISCDKTEVWNGRGPQSPKSESLVFVFQPCYRVQYLLFICVLSSELCVLLPNCLVLLTPPWAKINQLNIVTWTTKGHFEWILAKQQWRLLPDGAFSSTSTGALPAQ